MPNKKRAHNNEGGRHMAILTAKCDQPFIVTEKKAVEFRSQKRDIKAFEKINTFAEKIARNVKTSDDEK